MKVGVIREIKDQENRVALTPVGAQHLAQAGHTVLIQEDAGVGSSVNMRPERRRGWELMFSSGDGGGKIWVLEHEGEGSVHFFQLQPVAEALNRMSRFKIFC